MPNLSLSALSGGTMALVVQLARDRMVSLSSTMPWLTPGTMFLMSPLPGAVRIALLMPGHFRCWPRPSRSRHLPVLSTSSASLMPYWV